MSRFILLLVLCFSLFSAQLSAQPLPDVDSVRIDSIKFSGLNGRVFFKYWNLTGIIGVQLRFGVTPNSGDSTGSFVFVPVGTDTASIGFIVPFFNTSYNLRVVFQSGTDSPISTVFSPSAPPPTSCSVTASTSSSTICLGGSATLTATGTAGMSYSWTPGTWLSSSFGSIVVASPVMSTTYTVVGTDANNCSDTATVFVNVSTSLPSVIVSSDTIICLGDTITLRVSGGSSYQWWNNSTADSVIVAPVANATYNVTVTGAICSVVKQIKVQVVVVNPSVSVSTDSVCVNGIQNILVTGLPAGGVWSTNTSGGVFDHGSAGVGKHSVVYTLTTPQGCVGKDTVYVSVLPAPRVDNWVYDQSGNLTLNGSFPYNVFVVVNGTPYQPTVQNNIQAIFSNLTINVSDLIIVRSVAGDCFTSFYLGTTNVEKTSEYDVISYYPNPFKNTLYIKSTQVGEMLQIVNLHGQEIFSGIIDGEISINTEEFPTGIYYARVGNRVVKILRE